MARLTKRARPIIIELSRTVASVEGVLKSNLPLRRITTSQAVITITTACFASVAARLAQRSRVKIIGPVWTDALEDCRTVGVCYRFRPACAVQACRAV